MRRGLATTVALVGAVWARGAGALEPSAAWPDDREAHWAFRAPVRPVVPSPRQAGWGRTPIDAFVLHDLEAFGLATAEEADRATLIRRLRFDLTGLPPSPGEVAAFVADPRPDAYERLVDRLLSTPAYGERWARPWLDLARYAESDGFKSDKTRPHAWRYRDWVVQALNDDVPYDRFLTLQLAGDEVAPGDPKAFVATGFNRNWPFEDNNKVPGLNHQLMLDDMTDTTASVFLGLTVACARCHDHKFDPIRQVDYYRFQAIFAATGPRDDRPLVPPFDAAVHEFVDGAHAEDLGRAKRALAVVERPFLMGLLKDRMAGLPADLRQALETNPEERSAFQEDLLTKNAARLVVDPAALRAAMPEAARLRWGTLTGVVQEVAKSGPDALPVASGMADSGVEAPPTFLRIKGNPSRPGEAVTPGFPAIFGAAPLPLMEAGGSSTGRRAALALWLTRPEHPLTARVMVNRLWQGHFGRGLVATPSDFGTRGAEPSHPELLDWLAEEFVSRGWSLKAMHRLMVTSSSYRQSSTPPARTLAEDPDNALFGRMPRRRLEGEAVRDALLAVSGTLNPAMGGPSVFPDLPPGVQTRGGWTRSVEASDRDRRSLYVFARRNLKYPLFDAFDAPDPNVTCPERNVSVNAPQALMLLNADVVIASARDFAGRLRREEADESAASRVERAFRLALGRGPDPVERDRAVAFLANGAEDPETLADFCHALLNLNEFVFVD